MAGMTFLCMCSFLISLSFAILGRNAVLAECLEKSKDKNGTVTCATDDPSLVIPLDRLLPLLSDQDSCVAPGALCAMKCLQDSACTNYNYRAKTRTCEIFHYTPSNCAIVTGCYHAEVGRILKF